MNKRHWTLVEGAAGEGEDLPAGLALELGHLLVGVGAAHDAGAGPPRVGIVGGDGVGDDHLVDGVLQPPDLLEDGPGLGVVGHGGPEPLEPR